MNFKQVINMLKKRHIENFSQSVEIYKKVIIKWKFFG